MGTSEWAQDSFWTTVHFVQQTSHPHVTYIHMYVLLFAWLFADLNWYSAFQINLFYGDWNSIVVELLSICVCWPILPTSFPSTSLSIKNKTMVTFHSFIEHKPHTSITASLKTKLKTKKKKQRKKGTFLTESVANLHRCMSGHRGEGRRTKTLVWPPSMLIKTLRLLLIFTRWFSTQHTTWASPLGLQLKLVSKHLGKARLVSKQLGKTRLVSKQLGKTRSMPTVAFTKENILSDRLQPYLVPFKQLITDHTFSPLSLQ